MSDRTDRVPNTGVRFARAATRHRVSKDRIRNVAQGQLLEVMAVEVDNHEMLVIHAMPIRDKYKKKYEQEAGK